jgi:hypothetical protein
MAKHSQTATELEQLTPEDVLDVEARITAAVAAAKAQALNEALALAGVNTSPPAPTTGIYATNPVVAKMAREQSPKKRVVALTAGYYGEQLREEGDIFEVPEDEVSSWFVNHDGQGLF